MRRAPTTICVMLAATAFPAVAAGAQRTAKLQYFSMVRSAPAGKVVDRLAPRRPLTGTPTVLPVIATREAAGRTWLRVRLPQRPNGSTGWIAEDGTVRTAAHWKVVVRVSRRRAVAYRDGRRVRSFPIVVGKHSTPTPRGRFFVAERVRQPRGSALGPWVLATSAYSNVLQEFDGGPGQIGLHGRTGLPDPLGSAASHGCVRFADRAIAWLAPKARPGTPIVIRR